MYLITSLQALFDRLLIFMHFFSFYPAEPSNQSYLSIFTVLAGAPGNGRSSCANNHGCQGDYFINALLSFFKGSVKVVEEVNGF